MIIKHRSDPMGHPLKRLFTAIPLAFILLAVAGVARAAEGTARQEPTTRGADATAQKIFQSPQEAMAAFIEACRKDDPRALLAIFGPDARELVFSGDETADSVARRKLAKVATDEIARVTNDDARTATIYLGRQSWPFPIPIVKGEPGWRFDTAAGKEELLNRRIGANELRTIEVCRGYVAAQREYAARDRNGDEVLEYAQKIRSEKGKHDGLYWETMEDEEPSPMGPLAARAIQEGYGSANPQDKPMPYHGYYYKILTAQGKNAPGGDYSYIINGRMIAGLALVAYPAEYASSGIMTFIVSQQGVVHQKDLGKDTGQAAKSMDKYDPDRTWERLN
jgi:hypothetical protein